MKEYPNIFEFASKELTQDAIVCWFLECASRKIEIGKAFLKMIFDKQNIPFDAENYEFECKATKQCSRIDVYTCIQSGETLYPIIFEDKVDTTIHDNQLKRYCETVKEWFKDNKNCKQLLYVYFKTGYMFNNEKEYIKQQIEDLNNTDSKIEVKNVILELKDIIDFLDREEKNELMKYYLDYCKKCSKKQNAIKNRWKETSNNESLCYHIGQGILFEKAFGEKCKWLISNSGKTEYSVYNICHSENQNNEWAYTLCYRFEPKWEEKNGVWLTKTYLQIQLYRNDSSYDSNDKWFDLFEKIIKKSTGYLENKHSRIECDYKSRKKRKHNYNGAEIMRIVFNTNGKNAPEDVAHYVKDLKNEINKYKEKFPQIEGYDVIEE